MDRAGLKRLYWKVFVAQVRIFGMLLAVFSALFLVLGVGALLRPVKSQLSEDAPVLVVMGALCLPLGIGLVRAKAGSLEDVERFFRGKDWRA